MNCQDFRELIDSYLCSELLTETNHDVLRHLENCADCRKVIVARRAVRRHLKSAVRNAPQFQIGRNFTHNLKTQLRHEALKETEDRTGSLFGLRTWLAVAAGLILTVTFGFFFLKGMNEPVKADRDDPPATDRSPYQTGRLSPDHLVNVAFGDHQHCAINHGTVEPVGHADTPAKYAEAAEIVMPQMKSILDGAELQSTHTCEYRRTKFTHLIVRRNGEILSVMLTPKTDAENLGEKIEHYTSPKYRLDRFDVEDTAVFVVSAYNDQINAHVAEVLYRPFHKYLEHDNTLRTALLTFY